MYMPDLSSYSYAVGTPLSNVAAVGWLDDKHVYPKGAVDKELLRKLTVLCERHNMRKMYGYHPCPFCGVCPVVEKGHAGELTLGSTEIWVPGSGSTAFYGAPSLVLHYCLAHEYLPPREFVEALAALDVDKLTKKQIAKQVRTVSPKVYRELEYEIAIETLPREKLLKFLQKLAAEDARNRDRQ